MSSITIELAYIRTALRLALMIGILVLAGCRVELYTDLDQRAANKMIAILKSDGIDAVREPAVDGRFRILVEESAFARAVEVLDQEGYPQNDFVTMGDVFEKSGLISSPTEERARMLYALNQELAMTLSEIDGVISARIHVVLPEDKPLSAEDGQSSAAVFIRYRSELDIQALVPHIKQLVSNSIPELDYASVSVISVMEDIGKNAADQSEDAPPFVEVAGLRVHADDAATVWQGLIAGVAFLVAGLLGAGLWLFFQYRRSDPVVALPSSMVAQLQRSTRPSSDRDGGERALG